RYVGQGYEIPIPIDLASNKETGFSQWFKAAFNQVYAANFGRAIKGVDVEVLSWTLTLSKAIHTGYYSDTTQETHGRDGVSTPMKTQMTYDPQTQAMVDTPVFDRADMGPGYHIAGPALISEAQTTIVVPSNFHARCDAFGHIHLVRSDEKADRSGAR
ncbi:MAG: hypothetical protein AAGF15_08655, partial [Pseudomonadota bacterium]